MMPRLENVDNNTTNQQEISYVSVRTMVDNIVMDNRSVDLEAMGDLLKEARLCGTCYVKSELASRILPEQCQPMISRLFRSFVASSGFLYTAGGNEESALGNYGLWNPGKFVSYVIGSFKRCCYNSLLIELLVASGQQPTMYFLKDTYDKSDPNILSLYDLGLLHKVDGVVKYHTIEETLCNYYIPFDTKNNNMFPSSSVKAVWNKIVGDMEKAAQQRCGAYGKSL